MALANGMQLTARRYIKPGSRISFRLSPRERDMIVDRAFLDPEVESRLRGAGTLGSRLVVALTLDDIDDLAGCVAAEANHCDDARIRRVFESLFDRLTKLQDRFTDAAPPDRPAIVAPVIGLGFTVKQGQYLAFIYYYTKIHGVPPRGGRSPEVLQGVSACRA